MSGLFSSPEPSRPVVPKEAKVPVVEQPVDPTVAPASRAHQRYLKKAGSMASNRRKSKPAATTLGSSATTATA